MIIARAPLRISFAGGGSDLPAAHRDVAGACCTLAINKYVTVTHHPSFEGGVTVAYRQIERVADAAQLQHTIVRAALERFGIAAGPEIHSIADIPGGTGLGSSSAFAVALIVALQCATHNVGVFQSSHAVHVGRRLISARMACELEPTVGKQDQYASALGGANLFTFQGNRVDRLPLLTHEDLGAHLLLLWTGQARAGDAGQHIAQQTAPNTQALASLAHDAAGTLGRRDYQSLGAIVSAGWALKRAQGASSLQVDDWIAAALEAGAYGAKLCGAGGGGFVLCVAPPERHAAIAAATGLRAVPIAPSAEGVRVWTL